MSQQFTAILFPGQGSQEHGMGRDLAETSSQAMELWKMAEQASGHPLREIFWEKNSREMDDTRYLQPALSVVNLNLWLHLDSESKPNYLAGHSLGEFSALCAAKVLDFKSTIQLTSLRGRLMAEADPDGAGGMCAVLKLDQEKVQELVQQVTDSTHRMLVVANYNTPKQTVISGEKQALEEMEPLVKDAKGRLVHLPVSGAFHSPMMREPAQELAKFMDKLDWKSPQIPVLFNSTASTEQNPDEIHKIMSRQMTSPVLFAQLIQKMHELGVNRFVEVGPKGVLQKMLPQILGKEADMETLNVSGLRDLEK